MLRIAVNGAGKRACMSSRLPRYISSSIPARQLSTTHSQLLRPQSLRHGFAVLPGSTRNLSLWSSKPATTAAPPPPDAPPIEETTAASSPAADILPDSIGTETLATPVPDVSLASSTTDAVTDTLPTLPLDSFLSIPPMHYGDIAAAGLGGWNPAALCRVGLEALHVSTGLPWFWTIVTGTVLARALILPLSIKGLRNSALLAEHQAETQATSAALKTAYLKKDQLEIQRATLKQRELYARLGINPLVSLATLLVQFPVTIGIFFGIKRMCELPIIQLKDSGFALLPDLTVADPTWILPLLTVCAINLQLSSSLRDIATNPIMPHVTNGFRVLSALSLVFIGTLPAGTQLGILTGVLSVVAQTFLLRIPAIRRLAHLPASNSKGMGNKSASLADSFRYAREWVNEKKKEARKAAVPGPRKAGVQTVRKSKR
ncbi:hypothetical protein BDW22DRAFT_1400823 [Trametopsis cervina]|nr:hypothetical protein BDW22DRAFT_1400823 [Trametopsis cervina]